MSNKRWYLVLGGAAVVTVGLLLLTWKGEPNQLESVMSPAIADPSNGSDVEGQLQTEIPEIERSLVALEVDPGPDSTASQVLDPVPSTCSLTIEAIDDTSLAPIEGARVRAVTISLHDASEKNAVQGVTDQRGMASLTPTVGVLAVHVFTSHGGYGTASIEDANEQQQYFVRVPVVQLVTVSGEVRDGKTSGPIPGARVENYVSRARDTRGIITDGRGRFTFPDWVEGEVTNLTVTASGYGKGYASILVHPENGWALLDSDEVSWNQGAPFVTIDLLPAKKIVGRVVTTSGDAVIGAKVRALGRVLASPQIGVRDEASAETDIEGHFVLDGLRVDAQHVLVCEKNGVGLGLRITAGEERDHDLVIVLNPYAGVSGMLVDRRNTLLAGAEVELRIDVASLGQNVAAQAIPASALSSLSAVSIAEEDGSFHVEGAAAESVSLVVKLGGYEIKNESVSLVPGRTIDVGTMQCDVESALLEGRIIDAHGAPVSDHTVVVLRNKIKEWARVRTSQDGWFSVAVRPDLCASVDIVLMGEGGTQVARWESPIDSFPVVLRSSERSH